MERKHGRLLTKEHVGIATFVAVCLLGFAGLFAQQAQIFAGARKDSAQDCIRQGGTVVQTSRFEPGVFSQGAGMYMTDTRCIDPRLQP